MKCEKCGTDNTKVIDGKPVNNGMRRRRRRCDNCLHKFSTMEITFNHLAGIKQAIKTMSDLYKEFGKFKPSKKR